MINSRHLSLKEKEEEAVQVREEEVQLRECTILSRILEYPFHPAKNLWQILKLISIKIVLTNQICLIHLRQELAQVQNILLATHSISKDNTPENRLIQDILEKVNSFHRLERVHQILLKGG